ncbi:hypothetical protein ACOME3_000356 [Neoechinorhynchus agilis]
MHKKMRDLLLLLNILDKLLSQLIPMSNIETLHSCENHYMYYDTVLLRCRMCPPNSSVSKDDVFNCKCSPGFYHEQYRGNGAVKCGACPSSHPIQSIDGFGCVACDRKFSDCSRGCPFGYLPNEMSTNGSFFDEKWVGSMRLSIRRCTKCGGDKKQFFIEPDVNMHRCKSCRSRILNESILMMPDPCSCKGREKKGGFCFKKEQFPVDEKSLDKMAIIRGTNKKSEYIEDHLTAVYNLCKTKINSASNLTACNALVNMAAVQHYRQDGVIKLVHQMYNIHENDASTGSTLNIPAVEYPNGTFSNYLSEKFGRLEGHYSGLIQLRDTISVIYAQYTLNGKFIGWSNFMPSPCGPFMGFSMTQPKIGFDCIKKCSMQANWFTKNSPEDTRFFEAYLKYRSSKTNTWKYVPIPVIVMNEYPDIHSSKTFMNNVHKIKLRRRFFSVDRKTTIPTGGTSPIYITILSKFDILFRFPFKEHGLDKIRLPLIEINYTDIEPQNSFNEITVPLRVSIRFKGESETGNGYMHLAFFLSTIAAFIETFLAVIRFARRHGSQKSFLQTFIHTLSRFIGIITDYLFLAFVLIAVFSLMFHQSGTSVENFYLMRIPIMNHIQYVILILTIFKTIDIVHLIYYHYFVEIYFIDWESPKLMSGNIVRKGCGWRPSFVANEWSKLQTVRKIPFESQLIVALVMMKIALSAYDNGPSTIPCITNVGLGQLMQMVLFLVFWTSSAMIHHAIYFCGYSRLIKDRFYNMIDLCSVANISILLLSERLHGYYIHGRSPHGSTDVELFEILNNFKNEKENLCSQRGLVIGNATQVFELRITPQFRLQIDNAVAEVRSLQTSCKLISDPITVIRDEANKMSLTNDSIVDRIETLPTRPIRQGAFDRLNDLLKKYIDHDCLDYEIREKSATERMLDIELNNSTEKSLFFSNVGSHKFAKVTFYGHERSFFVWNALVFMVLNFYFNASGRYLIFPGVGCCLLQWIAEMIRKYATTLQLQRKTMVDKRLLL